MRYSNRRAVITGMGAITPLGESVDEFWDGLLAGKSGVGPLTLVDPSEFPSRIAGEVTGFDPAQYIDPRQARRMARFSQMAVAASGIALDDSGVNLSSEESGRLGVVMGNGVGGFPTTEANARILVEKGGMKMSPYFISMILPNMASANVSRIYGLKGYTSTVITACAAGNQAIGEAAVAIQRGVADLMVAGGSEAGICHIGLGGFNVIRALSRHNEDPVGASRPFDAKRDGFVPAEGGAALVIESLEHALDRGANIRAEVVGYGVSSDAFHAVQPDEDGSGAARAIQWAMEDAGLVASDIDYINAHGTSTPLNDHVETLAIKKALGDHAYKVPISSTKSMIGHALGGSGALEAVVCVKTLETGELHPTINYEFPDPDCDLDYVPNRSREARVDTVLSNSFGFGGQNACVIFQRYDE